MLSQKRLLALGALGIGAACIVAAAIWWGNKGGDSKPTSLPAETEIAKEQEVAILRRPTAGNEKVLLELQPAGPDEKLYLIDNGSFYKSNQYRFAEYEHSFTYAVELPGRIDNARLILDLAGQYELSISSDGISWEVADVEKNRLTAVQTRQYTNRSERQYELGNYAEEGGRLYVKIADSRTDDPWGGILYKLKIIADVPE